MTPENKLKLENIKKTNPLITDPRPECDDFVWIINMLEASEKELNEEQKFAEDLRSTKNFVQKERDIFQSQYKIATEVLEVAIDQLKVMDNYSIIKDTIAKIKEALGKMEDIRMTETYRKYHEIEAKMSPEMRSLMLDLLVHKYLYYEMADTLISDYDYDMMERKWVKMGEDLGINMDEYPFAVDFPHGHPLSAQAVIKAKQLLEEKRNR